MLGPLDWFVLALGPFFLGTWVRSSRWARVALLFVLPALAAFAAIEFDRLIWIQQEMEAHRLFPKAGHQMASYHKPYVVASLLGLVIGLTYYVVWIADIRFKGAR